MPQAFYDFRVLGVRATELHEELRLDLTHSLVNVYGLQTFDLLFRFSQLVRLSLIVNSSTRRPQAYRLHRHQVSGDGFFLLITKV